MSPEEYYPIPPTKIQKAIICTPEEVQMWKDENLKLKTRITALEAQVAALQEIAITATSRAIYEECQGDCGRVICSPEKHKKDARRRLSEEYPEVFG